ncbi:MAG: hypothetical protein ACLSHO_15105 [Dysosmobacter sp.]
MKQYRWPGNVRELRNICERIVVMSSSRTVDQSTLMDLHIFRELPPEPAGQPASPSESLPVMLPQVIRKKDLAKELGVSRTTLWRMSKRLEQQKEQQTLILIPGPMMRPGIFLPTQLFPLWFGYPISFM